MAYGIYKVKIIPFLLGILFQMTSISFFFLLRELDHQLCLKDISLCYIYCQKALIFYWVIFLLTSDWISLRKILYFSNMYCCYLFYFSFMSLFILYLIQDRMYLCLHHQFIYSFGRLHFIFNFLKFLSCLITVWLIIYHSFSIPILQKNHHFILLRSIAFSFLFYIIDYPQLFLLFHLHFRHNHHFLIKHNFLIHHHNHHFLSVRHLKLRFLRSHLLNWSLY